MSEMKAVCGVLYLLDTPEGDKETKREALINEGWEFEDDDYHEDLIFWNGEWYEKREQETLEPFGFSKVFPLDYFSFAYCVLWYNGACSENEILKEGLDSC